MKKVLIILAALLILGFVAANIYANRFLNDDQELTAHTASSGGYQYSFVFPDNAISGNDATYITGGNGGLAATAHLVTTASSCQQQGGTIAFSVTPIGASAPVTVCHGPLISKGKTYQAYNIEIVGPQGTKHELIVYGADADKQLDKVKQILSSFAVSQK